MGCQHETFGFANESDHFWRFRACTHEEVDEEDHDHTDSDPYSVVDFGGANPIVDEDSTGCQLGG